MSLLSKSRPTALGMIALSVLALSVAGCKTTGEDHERLLGWTLVDPAERNPIMVTQAPTHLAIEVPRGRPGLLPEQRANVVQFVRQFRRESTTGKLVIAAPSGAPNEVDAVNAIGIIRGLARAEGVNPHDLVIEAYTPAEADPAPPLKLSFVRHSAEAPDCGKWPTNLAEDYRNLPYQNFGCATQRNLAAMVANPQDLLGPRAQTTSRPSERRDEVWTKWVKGQTTGAEKSSDERVKVKDAN